MRKSRLIAAGVAIVAAGGIAWGAGLWSTLPIVGQPSFCVSTVSGAGGFNAAGNVGGGGVTGQGQSTGGSLCAQTVPAGPPSLTGNELVPADTGLQLPATVTIPSGLLTAGQQDLNVLVGSDFGQALWQRGNTPLSDVSPNVALYGPDGWYVYSYNSTTTASTSTTVSKQTGTADQPANSLASARIQRPLNTTQTQLVCTGQLVPDSDSQTFAGKTAIFSVDMLTGANFSPTNSAVTMTIAYHSAADVTTPATSGQGTNTTTFASSIGTTQNITNYTEAVNTVVNPSTTWTRFSTSAAIPTQIPGTTTNVAGIGVKLCWTPTGTAAASDYLEIGKAQLEARLGSSVGFSTYARYSNDAEWARELTRFYQITENGNSATPIYANGAVVSVTGANFMFQFPQYMRITPTTSPITVGGFKEVVAGASDAFSAINTTGAQNTQRTGAVNGIYATGGLTAGNAASFVGSGAGTGVLGFSAEP